MTGSAPAGRPSADPHDEERATADRARRTRVAAVLLVAATAVLTHFARLSQLGLYEDDYWAIAPHLGASAGRLLPRLVECFTTWPNGRPLNHFLPMLLSTVGSSLGGLPGVYALAAVWLALNGLLVMAIVRRLASEEAAVVAALAYLLFPADSTKVLLVHAAHVQGAMTFLLAGVWLWLRGGRSRALAYPVAALTLLSYETAFLPFLGVPLLRRPDRRAALRAFALHLALCAGIVAIVAAIRFATGDARAHEAAGSPARTLLRMAASVFLGPWTSGTQLWDGPLAGWRRLDGTAALVAPLLVGGLVVVLRGRRPALAAPAGEVSGPAPGPGVGGRPSSGWLLAGAAVVWAGSYALTIINYPPTQTVGRMTSTHVAAAWPVSLAFAALWDAASRGRRWRAPAAAVLVAWLVGAVAYQHHLGREYVRAWREEQRFWTRVMELAPDAGPGWTVIADGTPLNPTPVILSNSWADYWAYAHVFSRGVDAGRPSFAHLGHVGQLLEFRREGDAIAWRPEFWGGPLVRIDPARLVLLHDEHGVLGRVPELQTTAGRLASAAPPAEGPRTRWPDTPVSRLLFPDRFR